MRLSISLQQWARVVPVRFRPLELSTYIGLLSLNSICEAQSLRFFFHAYWIEVCEEKSVRNQKVVNWILKVNGDRWIDGSEDTGVLLYNIFKPSHTRSSIIIFKLSRMSSFLPSFLIYTYLTIIIWRTDHFSMTIIKAKGWKKAMRTSNAWLAACECNVRGIKWPRFDLCDK